MKTFSLLFVFFLIYSLSASAQDTSFAVTSNGKVGIGTSNPASELDVNGTVTVIGKVNRPETGSANMVPVAYANVAADGTIRTEATTDNVALSSHTPGTGDYYFTIANEDVYYTNTMCTATILGDPGQISWGSSGGGTTLYIGTRNSSGAAQDMDFTFIVYKK